jgi:WhiB family redox-sensing transcriptional regulator
VTAVAVAGDTGWMTRGACSGHTSLIDKFFLPSTDPDDHEPAKRICAACPVDATCLEYALATGIDHGVWGGATVDERRAMRRARAGKATGMRNAREHLGLTQRGLAARVGVPQDTINKVERGLRVPTREVADRLVEVLGCPADQLFTASQLEALSDR